MMKILNCAMGGNIKNGDFLKPICDRLGCSYVRMSEWREHDILWSEGTWLQELSSADVVVCPQNILLQPSKSNNRATQAMALGKPVVCSPLEAYREAIVNGVNGFICDTPEEWESSIVKLLDAGTREEVGKRAKASVGRYSIGSVAGKWASVAGALARDNCAPPRVDVIISTFNNLGYLKICVESVRKNTDWPVNVIVVSSGSDGTEDWLRSQPDLTSVISKARLHFSEASNAGLRASKERYVCLLNDDTVVGVGWLGAMMFEAMKPGVGAVGPYSNCDLGWLHGNPIRVDGVDLVPNMKLSGVAKIIHRIPRYRHPKEVYERKWLAFYCVLMKREAVDKVGFLDEKFKSGDEDLDYCLRLRDAGYAMFSTYDSWVFHFGGKTRQVQESENRAVYQEENLGNHNYFAMKWGKHPSDPSFQNVVKEKSGGYGSVPRARGMRKLFGVYVGQGWERWSPKSIDDGGIGGSETCTVYTAREFARKGWRSVVFGDCDGLEGMYDGVEYIDHKKFESFAKANHFDFFVSSRRVDVFNIQIEADRKVCVVHDTCLSLDPGFSVKKFDVDKFFVLSPWHREFFLKRHPEVSSGKVAITRDGIDLGRFDQTFEREPGRMVYSSSPDRGLDVLLDSLPEIRKRVPGASLHVFYGFENWEKAVRERGRPGELGWMGSIKERLDDPGVVYRGRVGQRKLAKEMLRSELWAYPTAFTETFCITAVEQMASGNPVITSALGALLTTVGDAGVLIPGDSKTAEYKARFIDETVSMLTDKERWRYYHEMSLKKAKAYSWSGIADEWLGLVGLPL